MELFRDWGTDLDLGTVPIPPRSILFCLSPGGVGTPKQESLRSLLIRISRAHAVSPRHLIGQVFGSAEPAISKLAYGAFYRSQSGTVNGLGRYAELFVSAMTRLTGQDLRHLTLLPWRGLFPHNGQGFLARSPRWCPMCLYQQSSLGQDITFPLSWSVDVGRICGEHSCVLEDRCLNCGETQPHFPSFPDMASCNRCRNSLARICLPADVSDFELWVSEAIGDIVKHQSQPGFSPSVGRFRDFIRERIRSLSAGNRAAFCRAVGFHDRALNGWLSKGECPAIPQFLALCYGMKVMPTDIFTGTVSAVDGEPRLPPRKLKNRQVNPRPTLFCRQGWEQHLHLRLKSEEGVSLAAVAAGLDVTSGCLRYWFPDLCSQVSARYKALSKARSEGHKAQQSHRVEEVMRKICAEGRYPSRRQVNLVLKRDHMSLAQPHLLKAYLNMLANL